MVSHPDRGLVLVDGGAGPSMVPSRGRGLKPVGLFTPWEFLSAIEVSPVHLRCVVVTGPEEDRVSNLDRLPTSVPVYLDAAVLARHHAGLLGKWIKGKGLPFNPDRQDLRSVDDMPLTGWGGVPGYDLFGDGSCLLIALDDRRSGHLAVLMPRVEGQAEALVYITRPDLRIASDSGTRALETMPKVIRTLMKQGARVMHSADPDQTSLDVIEI